MLIKTTMELLFKVKLKEKHRTDFFFLHTFELVKKKKVHLHKTEKEKKNDTRI